MKLDWMNNRKMCKRWEQSENKTKNKTIFEEKKNPHKRKGNFCNYKIFQIMKKEKKNKKRKEVNSKSD